MKSYPISETVRLDYEDLVSFVAEAFAGRGMPPVRARAAAEALCHGDLTGINSHGVVNLMRLYLPLFDHARVDARAEPELVADRGPAVLIDARRALGLWHARDAMDLAVERAAIHGIAMIFVRGATHFGCAGHHSARAVRHDMVGVAACNCGRQRIARPPGGRVAMLGTNPLSVAAPAGEHHPFVLDMSTTAVPTGRVRAAARAGKPIPPGWLEDDRGEPVTDPEDFDRGTAHLSWLGGSGAGAFKGFGLALMVEVLAALVPGAGLGPEPQALSGDGTPSGRDDDIGMLLAAIAPGALRPAKDARLDAQSLFGTLLACPPAYDGTAVRYPGWVEAERARYNRRHGIPLCRSVYAELCDLASQVKLSIPPPIEGA